MAVIPAKVFRNVEWHLHNRDVLFIKALAREHGTRFNVLDGCEIFRKEDGMPSGKGKHSDPTAVRAMLLVQAGEEVRDALLWGEAIDAAFEYFDDMPVGAMAAMFYGQHITIKALALEMGVDEKTIDRMRDKFVCTCALFAASRGLVKIEKEGVTA